MAIVTSTIKLGEKIPQSVLDEVNAATKRQITLDEDCPSMSNAELAQVAAIVAQRKADRKKMNISLRVSERMIKSTRESIGKGYTGFLSRLLEAAMNEPELVKKCL